MNTVSTANDEHLSAIARLPPEIFFQVFLFLSHKSHYKDKLRACQICRSWLPGARAALYRSVIISTTNITAFARSIKENGSLVCLIRHLTFQRTNEASKGIDISEDLHTVSHNDTLFSLQLHANTLIDPRYHTETIRSLPSLRHLSLDTNIFPSLYAMKSFIASFPQLQGLEVNDEFGGDFSDEWYDESALDTPVELPITLRNLGYHLPGYDTLDALLRWIPRQAESSASVQRFSLTINRANDGAAVTPLLRAFGTGLEYLSLDYRWPSYIPTIDLNANTNLRSLALQMELFDEYADLMKTHLSHMFDTLSSSSLKVIDITIKLNSPSVSLDQVIDLEALEKSTMTTGINIFVSLPGRNVEETMEVEDWVEGQMPRHVSQSRLQCTVSRAWDTE